MKNSIIFLVFPVECLYSALEVSYTNDHPVTLCALKLAQFEQHSNLDVSTSLTVDTDITVATSSHIPLF